jgi:putative ABC transport system permease protein
MAKRGERRAKREGGERAQAGHSPLTDAMWLGLPSRCGSVCRRDVARFAVGPSHAMKRLDQIRLAYETLSLHRLRTGLTLAAIAIGVTAVLLLTALGDATKAYVVQEFASVGTNLVIVVPGKVETSGMPTLGGTTRELTIDDAEAVRRQGAAVRNVAPFSMGTTTLDYAGRNRDTRVIGSTASFLELRKLSLASGVFLPEGYPRQGDRVAVIGQTVLREVFQGENPLGKLIRLGDWRFRVIGVLGGKGESVGIDYDDVVIVPVSLGLKIFNQTGLFRIMVESVDAAAIPTALHQTREILMSRHDGDEDFTLITQDAMLKTFGSIIDALTASLAGIAAISLAVAGIGIMNVMLAGVGRRATKSGCWRSAPSAVRSSTCSW